MNHRTNGRDQAHVRRIAILIAVGIAVNVSALLYVSNGSADMFAWTYTECTHYRPEPPETSVERDESRAPLRMSVCDRWEARARPWLYAWLLESVATSVFVALAASLAILPGLVSR